jgi:methylenetetrahydrofolate--tRNA-(uracil-5-)-methyltransferase
MNTNFGLFPPLPISLKDKKEKRSRIGQRALEDLETWNTRFGLS